MNLLELKTPPTQEEFDALRAQVELLRNALEEICEVAERCDGWEFFPTKALDKAYAAAQATPAQCLQEIKADAYWKGYVAGGDDFRSRINIPLEVVTKKANEMIARLYPDSELAKKIRQAAKGE